MVVKQGDTVKVQYEGKFTDGTVFDSSEKHGEPLEFKVGAHMVVPGFEMAVIGMDVGQEKEVTLTPKDAYGDSSTELVRKFPKEHFPKGQEPAVGMVIGVGLENGHQIPARITGVSATEVTLDMNHPMAGKTLIFKIRLESYEA